MTFYLGINQIPELKIMAFKYNISYTQKLITA